MGEEAARAAFASQAIWCERLGSPFTARLVKLLGERLDRSTAIGRRVLDWPGDPAPEADNVPARLAAALHFLVRRGAAPALAALYPPRPLPEEDALWAEAAPLLAQEEATIHRFLSNAPQTNEVGRSSTLMAGLLAVADAHPLPMRLFELGASGGLNLLLDRYGHDLGGVRAGDAASPLQLRPAWKGPPPPGADVRIVSRAGVDLDPVDLAQDGERLLAFVWADMRERIARLEAALALAAAGPPPVERGDADDWLERTLPATPRDGAVRVVFHSVAYQYFPAATQQRIDALMHRLGAEATAAAPLAWLRYEQQPGEPVQSLRLRTWPGEDRHLAWAHPHGASVEWLATASARPRR
ncbi:MAG TPA: DUF2332 family protein [Allosphingosinicella sp.]|nr:DUF2332 family protein [Allosphingosinicella sp.]